MNRFMAPVDDYVTTNITLTKSQRRPGDSQRTNLKSEVSVCLRQLGVPPTMMSAGGSNTRISILNVTSNIRSRPGEIRPMATSSRVPPPKTLPAGHLPYIPWPVLPIVDCYQLSSNQKATLAHNDKSFSSSTHRPIVSAIFATTAATSCRPVARSTILAGCCCCSSAAPDCTLSGGQSAALSKSPACWSK